MIVKQIYTKCLAQASYFIESNGEVAIIDPIRDINEYIEYNETNEREKIYRYQMKEWKKKNKISENYRIISTLEHNFSHFQLKVLMVEILLNKKRKLEDFLWFSMSDFEKKPISKLMNKAQKNIL